MLKASHKTASVELDKIPLLPGTADAINSGIESTLAPDNRHIECLIGVSGTHHSTPEYRVLFDPQTSGGLLLGVPPTLAKKFEEEVLATGAGTAIAIGKVTDAPKSEPLLQTV